MRGAVICINGPHLGLTLGRACEALGRRLPAGVCEGL